MTLHDLLDSCDRALVGLLANRLTTVAAGAGVWSYWQFSEGRFGTALLIGGISAGVLGVTELGKKTRRFYREARASIEHYGRLDERYARQVILGSENGRMVGYCQQQGLYLAARDTGTLDAWRKARAEHSNIMLPHF